MLKWAPFMIMFLVICMVLSCGQQAEKEQGRPTEIGKTEMGSTPQIHPSISGIVRQSPPRGMPPRQESSRGPVVPGASVSLRRCTDKDAPAGDILVSAVTDSAGGYHLKAESGTYFLTVTDAKIPYPVFTKGYMGMNFTEDDSIQFSKIITLQDGNEVVDIVLPQRWPE